ncbi:MAG: ATP-binding protein, partial [bacterium]
MDLRTLFLILVITDFLQAIAIFFQYFLNKTYQGVGWWVGYFTATAVGFAFLLLRDFIAIDLISIILANALLLLGAIFLYIGSLRFLDKKENRAIVICIFVIYILFFFYFTYVDNNITIRSIIISIISAVVFFMTAKGFYVNKTRSITISANFVSAILLVYSCILLFRAGILLTAPPIDSIFTPTFIQTAVFLVQLIEGILLTFGLIIMVNQRLTSEMREAKEHFELIFNTSPDASLITRMNDGLIVNINEGFTALTGFTREETIGKSSLAVNLWKNSSDRQKVVDELGKKGFSENFEALFQRKDGSQLVGSMSTKLMSLQGIPHIISVTRDITERKELEERIRQVRSDLLFAVSHDLKSPLQSLHQTQEMLNELTPGEGLARFQEYSEIWRRNLQRLERMINNLVDSQRSEEGRFPLLLAPSNPAEMVKRVVEDSQGYALSSAVTFDLKLQPVPEGSCDEEALARVVENLLINAVKFSPKGGKVEVRLGMEGDTLLLEVEDHGLGIPAAEQAQLFQPFQRGSSAHEKKIPGTGLGLYVCRRIVEEHGGSIT